jgi:HPt (histidine-containing phosphotransfer) domain-containing protein
MDDHVSKPLRSTDLEAVLATWVPLPRIAVPAGRPDEWLEGDSRHGLDGVLDSAVVQELVTLLRDNARAADELVAVFATEARQSVAALADAHERRDGGRLLADAHRLKGSAANIGAARLAAAAAELELAVGRGDALAVQAHLAALSGLVARSERALTQAVRAMQRG